MYDKHNTSFLPLSAVDGTNLNEVPQLPPWHELSRAKMTLMIEADCGLKKSWRIRQFIAKYEDKIPSIVAVAVRKSHANGLLAELNNQEGINEKFVIYNHATRSDLEWGSFRELLSAVRNQRCLRQNAGCENETYNRAQTFFA